MSDNTYTRGLAYLNAATILATGFTPENIAAVKSDLYAAGITPVDARKIIDELRPAVAALAPVAAPDVRFQNYTDYISAIFRPGDTVCFVSIVHNRDKNAEKVSNEFVPFETALTPAYFQNLSNMNNANASIYVAMNTYPASLIGSRVGRTQENVVDVRALQADVDYNAETALAKIQASTNIPAPSIVVESSTGKFQGIWLVDGFTKDEAKPVMQSMVSEFGSDAAVAEIARVMRVPGFVNRKYESAPVAKTVSQSNARYQRSNFHVAVAAKTAFETKPENWVNDVVIKHGDAYNGLLKISGYYIREKNINDPEMLYKLLAGHCETAVDRDGVTPWSPNMDQVRAYTDKWASEFKTGEEINATGVHLKPTLNAFTTAASTIPAPATAGGDEVRVRRMSEFESKKLEWMWKDRILYGALCTLGGEPDKGKSLVSLYVAACVSRGERLYDNNEDMEAGEVLMLACEDDPETTLRPRLMAAGADLKKIHWLESVISKDAVGKTKAERLAQLDSDISMIGNYLDQNPAIKLVIIDPISSYLGNANMNRDQEVRKVLNPLVKRAQSTGLAVLMIAHFNKNSEARSAMDRIGGCKAFVALSRSSWVCVDEPKSDEPKTSEVTESGSLKIATDRRLFLKLKNNLAPSKVGGLVYEIRTKSLSVKNVKGEFETAEVPYVIWTGTTESTAQDVVIDGKPGKGSKGASAVDKLQSYLESVGGHSTMDRIKEAMAAVDVKGGTLTRSMGILRLEQHWVGRESYRALPGKMPPLDSLRPAMPATASGEPTSPPEVAKPGKVKRPGKRRNMVSLNDVEPETVGVPTGAPEAVPSL